MLVCKTYLHFVPIVSSTLSGFIYCHLLTLINFNSFYTYHHSSNSSPNRCLHCLQVWLRGRWCHPFNVATGCPGLQTVPLSCMTSWCPAGGTSLKTDPPLTTCRASWTTSTPQQRDSTNISRSATSPVWVSHKKTYRHFTSTSHCVLFYFMQISCTYISHSDVCGIFVYFYYNYELHFWASHSASEYEGCYI